MSGLVVQDLRAWHRPETPVVHGVDLTAPAGQITALLGPNGAGKSTLLKALLGLVGWSGHVALDGTTLQGMAPRERARRLAYVPQRTRLAARLTVRQVVGMGRFAHRGAWGGRSADDLAAVDQALADAGIVALQDRWFTELSGGEQQRVLLARALATGARTLLLDEPTSALDVRHGLGLQRVLRAMADRGCCVVIVVHDLSEARAHADRAVLLDQGRVAFAGPVDQVIQPDPVRQVYGVELIEGGGLGYRLP